ncbi:MULTISPECIES: NADP-dependent oxidoreductase [Alphaproteobacteria]|uniref:NADP-dependent oxidoreductase n=1 Tax=Methylobacterium currus TaxID=2051553 RepID=A0A2R4WW58_9HYPH|nr:MULTISPECIES: NADP-dependent oxidoreductase [Alphaproteobacteria]AWB25771.1 NADP-dependent oxidoreductase [Methylobacterium currus]MBX3478213.1 NADP-dependent oxidoreductase [Brevundimonas sp.]NGM32804.1 NADP-dependent oxidoreductase [Methylobacterium sp. DB0501]
MTRKTNRQFTLAARPQGQARLSDFELVESAIPSPKDGEVLFRNTLFSIDPYQRNLMGNGSSEWPVIEIGDPMGGPTVAVVEESRNPDFAVGDHVQTWTGWQDYAVSDGSDLRKLDPNIAPLSTALGPLGLTGFTAWYGMTKVHDFKPGGTLVVTGAAGSVGSTAAQLGKLRGFRVVGVAGGPEKVAFLKRELGLDEAIDYKADDLEQQVARALPNGIDAFFENVGGPLFPVLMEHFNTDAKMTLCGTIADYSDTELPKGTNYLPRMITLIHYRFVSIKAFATPYVLDTFPEFLAEMTPLVTSGRIIYGEEFIKGFESLPETFLKLFDGSHSGKKLIVRAD